MSTSVDGQIRLYHNNAGKNFSNDKVFNIESQSCKVMLVDVNNDNYPELVASTRKGTVVIFYNSAGHFNSTPDFSPSGHGGLSFDVADLNNDGWPDIVTSNDGKIVIYYSNSGSFSDNPVHVNDNLDCYPKDIVATDLNNDSWLELIIASFNRPNLILGNAAGQLGNDTLKCPLPHWRDLL